MSALNKIGYKNTFYYSVGVLVPKLIAFFFIPVFSYFLSKEDLGRYDLAISGISLFLPLVSLQLGDACFRWAIGADDTVRRDNIKTALLSSLLFYALTFSIAYSIYRIMPAYLPIHYLFIVYTSSLILLMQYIARSLEKIAVYALSGIINSVSILALSLLLFWYHPQNLITVIYAYLIGNVLTLIYQFIALNIGGILRQSLYQSGVMKAMIKFSLPLIPSAISWWLVSIANRYIIALKMGVADNGFFAVATRIPSILLILNSVFLLILQELVFRSKDTHKDKSDYNKLWQYYFTIQMGFALVLVATSKLSTLLLFSDNYKESYLLSPLVITGILFTNFSSFWGTFFLASRNTINILVSTFWGGIASIITTFLLIPYIGLYAPAIGNIAGFMLIFMIRIFTLKKEITLSIDLKSTLILTLSLLLVSLAILSSSLLIHGTGILLSLSVAVYFNSDIIKLFLRLINSYGKQS